MCSSSQYSYGGCLFILVRFLSCGVEYLQMWALVRRLSGGIAPWCVVLETHEHATRYLVVC